MSAELSSDRKIGQDVSRTGFRRPLTPDRFRVAPPSAVAAVELAVAVVRIAGVARGDDGRTFEHPAVLERRAVALRGLRRCARARRRETRAERVAGGPRRQERAGLVGFALAAVRTCGRAERESSCNLHAARGGRATFVRGARLADVDHLGDRLPHVRDASVRGAAEDHVTAARGERCERCRRERRRHEQDARDRRACGSA
jgi:hypothetical protein